MRRDTTTIYVHDRVHMLERVRPCRRTHFCRCEYRRLQQRQKKNSLSGGGIRLATVLGLDQLIMAHQGRLNPLKIKFITLRK